MSELEVLLGKTRLLNQLVQRQTEKPTDFSELASTLSKLTESNIYVIGGKGEIMGSYEAPGLNKPMVGSRILDENLLTEEYLEWLSSFFETGVGCRVSPETLLTIIPVYGGLKRLGTLVLAKPEECTTQELILAEVGATVIGLEILRGQTEKAERLNRKKEAVAQAMAVLSYSEIEAVKYIFKELNGDEGFVVAIRLADKYMLTRSVIVNALRKLESAGVIQARSLGMKGTYIKVMNELLHEQLAKMG